MEIRKITSNINKIGNESQSSSNSYLARKINAPDSVSFSASKNQEKTLLKKICLAITAAAVAFSLNKPTTNKDSKQNIESNTNPTTVVQNDNIDKKESNLFIEYTQPTNTEDSLPEPKFNVGVISKPDKEKTQTENIKDKPPVVKPDEEINEPLPKYAPPPEEDTPTIPVIPDEEINEPMPKYAPPPEEDTPTIPVIPDEEINEPLPKYAPPPNIEEEENTPTPPVVVPDVPEEIVVKYAPPMDIG